MAELTPAYIAHCLAGDVRGNLRRATAWVGWLSERYYIEPVCPWIVLASVWPETMRDLGLEIDRAAVKRCGLVIACGPRISPGMSIEIQSAKDFVDITGLTLLAQEDARVISSRLDRVGIKSRHG